MAEIRVLTSSKKDGKPVVASGSQVVVGGQQIERVTDVRIEAPIDGLWELHLTVLVDPNTLFETLPQRD